MVAGRNKANRSWKIKLRKSTGSKIKKVLKDVLQNKNKLKKMKYGIQK